jgi:hypothetical protein
LIIGRSGVHQATEPEQWFRWPVKNDAGWDKPWPVSLEKGPGQA